MITAVDVGASKILVAQFGQDGVPLDEARFPTPPRSQDFLDLLGTHLDSLKNISLIVIGVPGIVDHNGVLLRCGNLDWKNLALKQWLESRYDVPAFVENDAKLAALAEVTHLATVPRLGLYLTVSTGIGGGIIVNGKLLPAFRNSEPGHSRVYFQNEWQQWQHFASGRALVKVFGKEAHEFSREVEWLDVADRLSRGLFAIIPTLQPDVIIFGGGVGNFFEHFDDLLEKKLTPLQPYITLPKLLKAHHPNEAVLYGCYTYATTNVTA
jgi:predicted NBD/HSP70 family sugar kinase